MWWECYCVNPNYTENRIVFMTKLEQWKGEVLALAEVLLFSHSYDDILGRQPVPVSSFTTQTLSWIVARRSRSPLGSIYSLRYGYTEQVHSSCKCNTSVRDTHVCMQYYVGQCICNTGKYVMLLTVVIKTKLFFYNLNSAYYSMTTYFYRWRSGNWQVKTTVNI